VDHRRDGVLRPAELAGVAPSDERIAAGPVVIVECVENIPCNPCVAACPKGAITIEGDINDTPIVDFDTCDGCGVCISACPGLAIFVIDASDPSRTLVSLPYEFIPLPEVGEAVTAFDREGNEIGDAEVVRVLSARALDRTPIVTIALPPGRAMDARHARRKDRPE